MVKLDEATGVIEIVESPWPPTPPRSFAVTVALTAVVTEGAVNSPLVRDRSCVGAPVNLFVVGAMHYAVNCWLAPDGMFAVAGETVTVTCSVFSWAPR